MGSKNKIKILKNKRTNQLMIILNRKQFNLKGRNPKFIKNIKEENLEF